MRKATPPPSAIGCDRVFVRIVRDMAEKTSGEGNVTNYGDVVNCPPSPVAISPCKETGSAANSGRYDCELVDPSQTASRIHCSLCKLVLQDPCVVSCCDSKYCRGCVQALQDGESSCLDCDKEDVTFTKDRGLGIFLTELLVWCPHKKEGCEWSSKLHDLGEHLNQRPSPETRLNGCQFVEVECSQGCGEDFQRHNVLGHERDTCKERPYSCHHCLDYHSTFEDVTEAHHLECDKYPVFCPNKCQESVFDRCELEKHLDECPLALCDCPFHYTGCEIKLTRKDMTEHTTKEAVMHLSLLASVTQNLLRENVELKDKVSARETQLRQLQHRLAEREQESCSSVAVVRQFLRDGEHKQQELVYQQQSTDSEIECLKQEMYALRLELVQHTQNSGFPITYHINFRRGNIFLPPFLTHPHGYRLCLRVYPNGYGRGSGTHVSIFMYLVKGSFDTNLKWPFGGELTVRILNQAGDHDHWEDTTDRKLGGIFAVQVVGRERAGGGWGFEKFLPHSALQYDRVKNIQYLKDGHFFVSVVCVKCM